jgi:hypothetical protein
LWLKALLGIKMCIAMIPGGYEMGIMGKGEEMWGVSKNRKPMLQ